MYAIVEISGKQYKVEKDATINVDHITDGGDSLVIDKVLMVADGDTVMVGKPYVANARVEAKILDAVKGKKVRGIKFKKRKNYTRTMGHRPLYSLLQISNVVVG